MKNIQQIRQIGLDLAKNVIEFKHPYIIGLEACSNIQHCG